MEICAHLPPLYGLCRKEHTANACKSIPSRLWANVLTQLQQIRGPDGDTVLVLWGTSLFSVICCLRTVQLRGPIQQTESSQGKSLYLGPGGHANGQVHDAIRSHQGGVPATVRRGGAVECIFEVVQRSQKQWASCTCWSPSSCATWWCATCSWSAASSSTCCSSALCPCGWSASSWPAGSTSDCPTASAAVSTVLIWKKSVVLLVKKTNPDESEKDQRFKHCMKHKTTLQLSTLNISLHDPQRW